MCEFLDLVPEVQKISNTVFGVEKFDVSSLTEPYSHFDCSRIYTSASSESSHIDWASYTMDEGFFNEDKERCSKKKCVLFWQEEAYHSVHYNLHPGPRIFVVLRKVVGILARDVTGRISCLFENLNAG